MRFSIATGIRNTAIGDHHSPKQQGSNNIRISYEAGQNIGTGSNNICIGPIGARSDTNTIRIGKNGLRQQQIVAGISGAAVPTGVAIMIEANGHLGTVVSSARFKDRIEPMAKSSEAIAFAQTSIFPLRKSWTRRRSRSLG
jgi:hypothetical protein